MNHLVLRILEGEYAEVRLDYWQLRMQLGLPLLLPEPYALGDEAGCVGRPIKTARTYPHHSIVKGTSPFIFTSFEEQQAPTNKDEHPAQSSKTPVEQPGPSLRLEEQRDDPVQIEIDTVDFYKFVAIAAQVLRTL
ncbi:hypothetical protein F511_42805 [Dorcoceras hygrometricum]|uniref:Uncharacterized protein n=1 Tax=Dorcoceras hygrometricum TaxID=472368 RepID=A0A2Z7D083_9LAMI|nr:hypothetical protein F511_42805 [Dorcoceras hygrometricum]